MPSIVATINVKEDKIEQAKSLFRDLVAGIRANEPGTLAYIVHQRIDKPTAFIFYEKYKDDEAVKIHGKNLAAHGAAFAGVMAGPPEILRLEEV